VLPVVTHTAGAVATTWSLGMTALWPLIGPADSKLDGLLGATGGDELSPPLPYEGLSPSPHVSPRGAVAALASANVGCVAGA
jgi:hypothetical protein